MKLQHLAETIAQASMVIGEACGADFVSITVVGELAGELATVQVGGCRDGLSTEQVAAIREKLASAASPVDTLDGAEVSTLSGDAESGIHPAAAAAH